PYKKSEQDAMLQYVKNGGSIFFIADHYNADRNKNRWDSSEVFNGYRRGAWDNPAKGMSNEEANSQAMQGVESSDWLSDNFGIRFRYNAIGDVSAKTIVSPEQSFGITKGVSSVAMHAGSTLAITNPKLAKGLVYLPENPSKWNNAVDSGVYNGGGIAEGPYAAIAKVGLGKS
ncbi:DNA-binding protein, partial [Bacillus sp. MHSD17]|nr:DNA-binding protein [Bacillus sp. MHSD17]